MSDEMKIKEDLTKRVNESPDIYPIYAKTWEVNVMKKDPSFQYVFFSDFLTKSLLPVPFYKQMSKLFDLSKIETK